MTQGGTTPLSDTCRWDTQYASGSPAVMYNLDATNLSQMRRDAYVRKHDKLNPHLVKPFWHVHSSRMAC